MTSWFPSGRNDEQGWRLDIVSLLAVIGESAMEAHAQKMTATWLCLLPRLIPAPQGLLKSERPKRLPPVPGITVVGAFSGTKVEELNFAANLIHDIEELEPYEFREYHIRYKYDHEGRTDTRLEEASKVDAERGRYHLKKGHAFNKYGQHEITDRLNARMISPENALTVGSCLITIGLFIWACILQDGVAVLSIACMSVASSLTGLAFCWKPKLAKRHAKAKVPDGDLVLKTRGGAFVVVHCNEEIARELYTGSDEVEYFFSNRMSRVFVGFGTLFLMVAVVLLGNCNWTMQAAIGATYLILNGAYWLLSLLPEKLCWHLSAYKVESGRDLPYHMLHARKDTDAKGMGTNPSFTRTLWYAIQRSKSITWIKVMEAAPQTKAWDMWIDEAYQNRHNEHWPAVERKNDIMNGTHSVNSPISPQTARGSIHSYATPMAGPIETIQMQSLAHASTRGSPTVTHDFQQQQQQAGAEKTPSSHLTQNADST